MKQYILIIVIIIIGLQDVLAQHEIDTALIQKSIGQGYTLNGIPLNSKRLKELLLANDESSQVCQSALANKRAAITLVISGSVIYAGGQILSPDVGLIKLAGGILVLASIVKISIHYKRTDQALEIYNNSIKRKNDPEQTVSIGLSSDGIGLQFNF